MIHSELFSLNRFTVSLLNSEIFRWEYSICEVQYQREFLKIPNTVYLTLVMFANESLSGRQIPLEETQVSVYNRISADRCIFPNLM